MAEPVGIEPGAAAEPVLATLTLTGRTVAEYRHGRGLDPTLAPRPHLHPVRTLGGTPVTDAGPSDHPWHLGLSVGVPDVDGANFWGGPTYLRGRGYTWRTDHGRIEHLAFSRRDDDGFDETLQWRDAAGEVLLAEERRVRARLVEHGWELELVTTLTNATARPLRLGSPATNGRDGAGYGGLFWRLPPASAPRVRTATAEGAQAVHGTAAPWLAWRDSRRGGSGTSGSNGGGSGTSGTSNGGSSSGGSSDGNGASGANGGNGGGSGTSGTSNGGSSSGGSSGNGARSGNGASGGSGGAFSLVFVPADAATRADPWFVRVTDYPGVGSQLAGHSPVVLAPGAALTRGLRTLVADGTLDDAAAARWATAVESHGSVVETADP